MLNFAKQIYTAIVHDHRPNSLVGSNMKIATSKTSKEVSCALQEHETAVSRLNRVICRRVHGRDCTCHEKPLPGQVQH